MKFILVVLFFIIADMANAQQTFNKLRVNDLNLSQESASSALTIDGTKKVKASSTVSTTELGYLDGVTSAIQTQINGKQATIGFTPENVANKSTTTGLGASDTLYPTQNAVKTYVDSNTVLLTGNQSAAGTKTLTGRLLASTTSSAFLPCPVMTMTQRNALSPIQGDCVYNSTDNRVEFYSGSAWASATLSTDIMKAPGMTNPKTCYFTFGGTGSLSSPSNCASTPCVEYYDSCSAVASAPTRSATGAYSFTWANGTWANSTFVQCQYSQHGGRKIFDSNYITITTASGGLSSQPRGEQGNATAAGDVVVSLSCTAQAP